MTYSYYLVTLIFWSQWRKLLLWNKAKQKCYDIIMDCLKFKYLIEVNLYVWCEQELDFIVKWLWVKNSWVGHILTHKGPLYLKLQQRIIHIKNFHFLISTVTADDLSLLGVRALVGIVTVIFGSFMGMFMGPTHGRVRLPEWCVGGNFVMSYISYMGPGLP